jgi:periplasmic divalent cation tolerance protein
MDYYAAADGNVRSKGTMYLVLHAQGEHAHGRWVGLSYDGPVVSGYATLARTQETVQAVMTRLLNEAELVDAHLAASAHIIHPITSIYRWEGAVHETTEARAFLRSRVDLLDTLTAYVVERHPYDMPNVTAIPIVGGNPDYLAWVRAETAERESTR